MTDATQIAREIYESLNTPFVDGDMLELKSQNYLSDGDVKKIAAALREVYAKANGSALLCPDCEAPLKSVKRMDGESYWVHPVYECPKAIQDKLKQADAEGYLRGRVDEAKECDAHAQREYRRGVEEAAKIAKENSDINKGFSAECDCYERILQRGTGDGE